MKCNSQEHRDLQAAHAVYLRAMAAFRRGPAQRRRLPSSHGLHVDPVADHCPDDDL